MKIRNLTTIAAAITLALAATAADARPRIPVLLQLTHNTTGTVSDPKVRLEGGTVVFTSDGDVTGPSPGHNEVYVWDSSTATTTRITTTVSGESRENGRETDSVGADDRPRSVAFVSTGDLDPAVGNADHNPEVFVWNRDLNQIRQLTNTVGVVNSEPFSSDSTKCIVFTSTGNLDNNPGTNSAIPPTGFNNVDGSEEVFLYSVLSGENFPQDGFFTQISNGPAGTSSHSPVVGGYIYQRQCATAAYVSDYDQLQQGLSGSNIYIWDRSSTRTELLEAHNIPWETQPGDYLHPAISGASSFARGPFIVFQTTADEWRNGSDGNELFRFRVFHPELDMYTDYLTGDVERPSVSDGGGYIAYQSTAEILDASHRAKIGGDPPFNADGNYEIFRQKTRRRAWQITNSSGCTNDLPSMRDNSTAIAFRSNCDLVSGGNPSGIQQVFLYVEVEDDDPLATAGGCLTSAGCCNEANGCYHPIFGYKPLPPRAGCIDSTSGCEDLSQ